MFPYIRGKVERRGETNGGFLIVICPAYFSDCGLFCIEECVRMTLLLILRRRR